MTAGSLKNPEYRTRKSHIIAVIMFLAAAICIPRGSYAAVGEAFPERSQTPRVPWYQRPLSRRRTRILAFGNPW